MDMNNLFERIFERTMKKQTKTKVRAGICLNRNGAWRLDLNACLVTDADRLLFLKANGWQRIEDLDGNEVFRNENCEGLECTFKDIIKAFYRQAWVDYKTKHNLREK